jgi:arylsulfatase A-like enzyme
MGGCLLGSAYGITQAIFFFDRFTVVKNVFGVPDGCGYRLLSIGLILSYCTIGLCCGIVAALVAYFLKNRSRNIARLHAVLPAILLGAFGYLQISLYLNGHVFAFYWGRRAFLWGWRVREALLDKKVLTANFLLIVCFLVIGAALYRWFRRHLLERRETSLKVAFFLYFTLVVPLNYRLPQLTSISSLLGNVILLVGCIFAGWAFSYVWQFGILQRVWWISLAAAVAIVPFLAVWRGGAAKAILFQRSSPEAKILLRAVNGAFDPDGDGFTLLSPVRDCNNWDGCVNVLATDVPGNGIDEDCYGGDFSLARFERFVAHEEQRRAYNDEAAGDGEALRRKLFRGADPHVFIVCIDALRSDHIALNGYPRETTPYLDEFFRKSVFFPRCVTPSCGTGGSLPGMLTSRYQCELFRNGGRAENFETVQELLKERGYRTSAFYAITSPPSPLSSLERDGFDYYFEPSQLHRYRINAAEMNRRVMKFLMDSGREKPIFSLIGYSDTHAGYYSAPPFSRFFGNIQGAETIFIPRRGEPSAMELRYDRAIAWTDSMVAELMRFLEMNGFAERSAIIVTGDHGEEFYEHGGLYHGSGLFQELTTVPLAFRLPRGEGAGKRYAGPVQSLDIVPTVLQLAGARVPEAVRGWSLTPCLGGEEKPPEHSILTEALWSRYHYLMALLVGSDKFIHNFYSGDDLLYNVEDDPREEHNIADSRLDLRERLKLELFNLKSFLMLAGESD